MSAQGTTTEPNFNAPETIVVDSPRVVCDGGDGALGHPRVSLEMGEGTEVDCPYCDRHYVLKPGAGAH